MGRRRGWKDQWERSAEVMGASTIGVVSIGILATGVSATGSWAELGTAHPTRARQGNEQKAAKDAKKYRASFGLESRLFGEDSRVCGNGVVMEDALRWSRATARLDDKRWS